MTSKFPKRQNRLLVGWLILIFVFSVWFAFASLVRGTIASALFSDFPPQLTLLYGSLNLVSALCVIFMFRRRKSAFKVFGIVSTLILVLNLVVIVPNLVWLWGLIGLAIIYLIVNSQWKYD